MEARYEEGYGEMKGPTNEAAAPANNNSSAAMDESTADDEYENNNNASRGEGGDNIPGSGGVNNGQENEEEEDDEGGEEEEDEEEEEEGGEETESSQIDASAGGDGAAAGAATSAEPKAAKEAGSAKEKEEKEEVDRNFCRCCQNKDDLIDIFSLDEDRVRISDKISRICTNVKIHQRDHLPHVICKRCVEKVKAAVEFKDLCERTDKDLRKKLKRSYNKVRRTNDFVLIDYAPSDNSDEDAALNADDDDFKLSDEEIPSEVDSDVSYTGTDKPKKKRGRKPGSKNKVTPVAVHHKAVERGGSTGRGRGRGRGRGAGSATPRGASASATPRGTGRGRGRPPKILATPIRAEATSSSESEEDDDDEDVAPSKVSRRTCSKCNEPMPRGPRSKHVCKPASASKTEATTPTSDPILKCQFCNLNFRLKANYDAHQVAHQEFRDCNVCIKCHKKFGGKIELRKHVALAKCQKSTKNDCPTCEKSMASEARLIAHLQAKCTAKPSSGTTATTSPSKKESAEKPSKSGDDPSHTGKNLFKCVAPLTTTYWSDSYSE